MIAALLLCAQLRRAELIAELTADNFDDFIRAHRQSAVLFYAPWEEQSQALHALFLGAAASQPLAFGRVDIMAQSAVADVNEVSLFPVIKLFHDGRAATLPDVASEEQLLALLRARVRPPTKLLYGDNEFEELERYPVALLFLLPADDAAALAAVHGLLDAYRDLHAAHTHDRARVPEHTGEERFALKAYRLFDEGNRLFVADALDVPALRAFIDDVRRPNVIYFDQNSIKRVFREEREAVVLFTAQPASAQLRAYEAFAKAHKGRIAFTVAYMDYGVGQKLAEMFGVAKTEDNALRAARFSPGALQKFACGEATAAGFAACLAGLDSGTLQPYLRSDPLPVGEEGPVRTLVTHNFASVVLNREQHVLVLLFAGPCSQCAGLFDIFETVARLLRPIAGIVFARLDIVRNEVAGLKYKELPALSLYLLNEEVPREIVPPRTAKELLESLGRETGLDVSNAVREHEDRLRPNSEEF